MASSNESKKLNTILEQLGVTGKNIRRRRRDGLSWEFSYGYPTDCGYQWAYPHFCGSVSDGLVSPLDQTSDIDFQYVIPVNIVGKDKSVSDLPYHFVNQETYTIENSLSHPLFKRLKYVSGPRSGVEFEMSEQNGYLPHHDIRGEATMTLLENSESLKQFVSENLNNMLKQKSNIELNPAVCISGPAVNLSLNTTKDTYLKFGLNMDHVFAVRCFFWPDDMTEWFHRKRSFNWPTSDTIDRIKDAGCTFVSKGSEDSEQFNIEWRLAFTIAERILISTFNDTQRKCYVLLKLFHKKYIKYKFPGSVSSYHIKTVMMWVSEETCHSEFRRDRIEECFFMCIDRLVAYLVQCHCPLYFNKAVNLFYKITQDTCNKIVTYLGEVKEKTFPKFLQIIEMESMQYCFLISGVDNLTFELYKGCFILMKFYQFTENICNETPHEIQKTCIDTLLKQIEVNFFVFNYDTSILDRYLCDLKANLLSIAISSRCSGSMSNKTQYQLLKAYSSLLPSCLVAETCPAILKRATICYKFGKYSECFYLALNAIEKLSDENVIYTASHIDILTIQGLKIITKMMYTFNKSKQLCYNVSFSPMERPIVSDIVKEEMDIPKTYDKSSWLGWAFVDSIIYAYYLAVMCQHQVSDHPTRDGFISEMEDLYNRKVNDLFYPEAAIRFLQHCKALH